MNFVFFHSLKIHLKSYAVALTVSMKGFLHRRMKKKLYSQRYDEVHVVCPGPSASEFFGHKQTKNSCVIFINHAVKMLSEIDNIENAYYWSTDGTRVIESSKTNPNELKKCTTVLAPFHLYHLNPRAILQLDIVILPKLRFTWKNGIEGVKDGPESFGKLKWRPMTSGFGSLVNCMQLAILFGPKIIRFWGCDMGEKKGVRYFDPSVPVRVNEEFNLTKEHFAIVRAKIEAMGINFVS